MRLNLRQKLEARWNRLTLRRQLVICLWLCTIPISAAGSGLVLRRAYEHAQLTTRETMAFQLATLAQVMSD